METLVVLVVDRDEETRDETATLVASEFSDVSVLTAGTVDAAIAIVDDEDVDVLVTGYNFETADGLELVRHARETSPDTGCILYTVSEVVDTVSFEDVVVEFVGKDQPDAEQTLLALIDKAGPELTQASYPVPETEAKRAEETESLLSTGHAVSDSLERVARLANQYFDSTGAAVTVLRRDEQELLAHAGDVRVPTRREESLATHTLVSDGGLAVADTRSDPRFEDVDTIQEAVIVSYLGAVIESPDGHPIGVLNVYDDHPRQFSATDTEYLTTLADVASDLISLQAEGST